MHHFKSLLFYELFVWTNNSKKLQVKRTTYQYEGGGSALGRRLPKGALEEKETRGDKGREGTLKNEKMGRRLLWMGPKAKVKDFGYLGIF